ncbi:hypothetical protein CC86DRAFT_465149 [Ophiobolus disseminans]|uniref:Uncharacterized protein n=1 Tax=Ophiobolus disseminans TaxID=1469910 RepID=A0A6A7A8D9_9PLEO|nr:hypothetical protein CC86DRAFT_465149 [Ophiobolus disseminans]
MFSFLRDRIAPPAIPDRRPSTAFLLPTNDIDVRIGKPPRTRLVHVPYSAMKASPTLLSQLSHGATIVNADPIIFEIALEYLEQTTFLGRLRLVSRNPFEKLIGSSDMMLKLAKAWHLRNMLELPQMQNRLIDTFSACYRQFLEGRMRMPLCREPFEYLRDHMGYHTKCEKFLIEFYAGLARHGEDFRPEDLVGLPKDIVKELQYTRSDISVRRILGDRIAQGNFCFKVGKNDNTQRFKLQVLSPQPSPVLFDVPTPSPKRSLARSMSSLTSYFSGTTIQSTASNQARRRRVSFPLLMDLGRDHGRAVSRTLEPALRSSLAPTSRRPPPSSRTSSTSYFPEQAPFVHSSADLRHKSALPELEHDSTDDESVVYDLLSSDLRWRQDSHQIDQRGVAEKP